MTDHTFTPELLDSRLVANRPWLDDIVVLPHFRCRSRVLLVADGALDFGTGGFGLSTVVDNLRGMSTFWHSYQITTAHRGGGVADINGFTFDSSVTRSNYDQIWLFGIQVGPGLPPAELSRVSAFMDAGGGVFATGDHEALGSALSGNIPRVKSMRLWHFPPAPSGFTDQRIDTVSTGPTPDFQFDDQSDAVAQTIYPRYYMAANGTTSYPHALLRRPGGDITVLPDHPHEGECVVPASLDPAEFPPLGGSPFGPEVIAIGVSRAGFLTDVHKPPVVPRGFGVIGAYDGRRVGLGRVVVDSTWHHYVNINLVGTGAPGRIGLQSSPGVPTAEMQAIKAYQRNIVRWLDPFTRCWFLTWPLVLRYEWPLIEEIPPRPVPDPPFEELVRIGKAARHTVATLLGETEAAQLSVELADLLPADRAAALSPLVDPWFPETERRERAGLSPLVRSEVIGDALLGGALSALAGWLPEDPSDAAKAVEKEGGREGYERVLAEGVVNAAATVGKAIHESSDQLKQLAKQMR